MHQDTQAMLAMISRMQYERIDFFAEVRSLGMRTLRFDMGYSKATGRAFLNEFATSSDGCVWASVTGQDLNHLIGTHMIDGMYRCDACRGHP